MNLRGYRKLIAYAAFLISIIAVTLILKNQSTLPAVVTALTGGVGAFQWANTQEYSNEKKNAN